MSNNILSEIFYPAAINKRFNALTLEQPFQPDQFFSHKTENKQAISLQCRLICLSNIDANLLGSSRKYEIISWNLAFFEIVKAMLWPPSNIHNAIGNLVNSPINSLDVRRNIYILVHNVIHYPNSTLFHVKS